jgi:hypothetical protein
MEATKVVENLKSHPYLSSYIRIAGEVDNDEKDEHDEDDDRIWIQNLKLTLRRQSRLVYAKQGAG